MQPARRMLLHDEQQRPRAARATGVGARFGGGARSVRLAEYSRELLFRHARILGVRGGRHHDSTYGVAGASGYSFKEWKGTFYPEKMKPDEMLAWYAERLPTVEINNTFYRMPKVAVLEHWATATPERFRFAIKASRRITHDRAAEGGCGGGLGRLPVQASSPRSAPSAGRCCSSCRRT